MKTATNTGQKAQNVQNSNKEEKKPLTVVQADEGADAHSPKPEKVDQVTPEKIEEVKGIVEQFAPTAEDRIKRAQNFGIVSGKYTHLKMKSDELEKFILSSDGTKEKIVLENSAGLKIEVNNSVVLKKAVELFKSTLAQLLQEAEQEVKAFVI